MTKIYLTSGEEIHVKETISEVQTEIHQSADGFIMLTRNIDAYKVTGKNKPDKVAITGISIISIVRYE